MGERGFEPWIILLKYQEISISWAIKLLAWDEILLLPKNWIIFQERDDSYIGSNRLVY